jgi:hypothetical protein
MVKYSEYGVQKVRTLKNVKNNYNLIFRLFD